MRMITLTKILKVNFSWKMACDRAIKDMQKEIKQFEKQGKGNNAMDTKTRLLKYQRKYKEKYLSG